ncbi:hypothetical protein [Pseudothermotoga sp.]|uniref:hypothetical protein n=1 Tax=Pseudothermotoga sp. TaxID=2033661 RepID=UPI0031F70211
MDLVGISLKDAILEFQFTCPICSLVKKAVDSSIDTFFYELVNDVGLRSELRSKGLCQAHVQRIESYLSHHMELSFMSLAIVYADLLDHLAKLTEKSSKSVQDGICLFCEKERTFEMVYLQCFIENIQDVFDLYSSSESVLCFDHYIFLSSKLKDPLRNELKHVQLLKYQRLMNLLTSYINKHDYKNRENFTEEEILARKTAGNLIAKKCHFWRRSG